MVKLYTSIQNISDKYNNEKFLASLKHDDSYFYVAIKVKRKHLKETNFNGLFEIPNNVDIKLLGGYFK